MPTTYKQKNRRQSNIISTVITAILIFTVFLSVISYFYKNAEEEANEMLHLQTKQIKDDLTLQLKSDRENLVTMANFAAKLYADGESYDIMFESFEPIGLFSNIGVLNPDNTFVTKMGSIDLDGKISFEEEVAKGEYVSGRVEDLTREGKEIIRSSVPIVSDGKTVGVLYGVILLENIGNKYNNMAKELDAQLFVYDKETGKFVIDTINKNPGELSQLKTRKYNEGYSYEDIANSDKGYSSFRSIYRDEDLYVHFSTLEEFDWGIMLARYETQVFAKTHKITNFLTLTFLVIVLIIVIYFLIIIKNEKLLALITKKASDIRKQLLEINEKPENIKNSLKKVMDVSSACSAMFFDTEGEDHHYTSPKNEKYILSEEDRKYFKSEIFRYAIQLKTTAMTEMSVANIRPDEHLRKINPEFYDFLNKHGIKSVIFSAISQTNNDNVSVLGLINPKNIICAKGIVEKIAVCFSIAIHNKNHLNKTYTAATTDSLTGALNRVAYKKDLLLYDEEKSPLFTCIYIDVNELHIRNNRYGHAAGDEMLIYIANALKNLFFDQKVYRMGGDEFLVFVSNTEQATV